MLLNNVRRIGLAEAERSASAVRRRRRRGAEAATAVASATVGSRHPIRLTIPGVFYLSALRLCLMNLTSTRKPVWTTPSDGSCIA